VSTNPHERLIGASIWHTRRSPCRVFCLRLRALLRQFHQDSGGFSISRWQSFLGAACRLRASQLEVDVSYKFGSAGARVSKTLTIFRRLTSLRKTLGPIRSLSCICSPHDLPWKRRHTSTCLPAHVEAPRCRVDIARHPVAFLAKRRAAAPGRYPTENGVGSEKRLRTFRVIRATLLS
jgi:hypothetical protein